MKIKYEFNSTYVGESYERWDDEEFEYEIVDSELKEYVAKQYLYLILGEDKDIGVVYDLLDQLDYEGVISWEKLINSFKGDIEIDYEKEANKWYASTIDLGGQD